MRIVFGLICVPGIFMRPGKLIRRSSPSHKLVLVRKRLFLKFVILPTFASGIRNPRLQANFDNWIPPRFSPGCPGFTFDASTALSATLRSAQAAEMTWPV